MSVSHQNGNRRKKKKKKAALKSIRNYNTRKVPPEIQRPRCAHFTVSEVPIINPTELSETSAEDDYK